MEERAAESRGGGGGEPGDLPRHEPIAASLAGIGIFIAAHFLGLGAVLAGLWIFASYLDQTTAEQRGPAPRPSPAPAPELLGVEHWQDPGESLRLNRIGEKRRLDRFDWVEPEKGIIRVPIETAKELWLQRGGRLGTLPEGAQDGGAVPPRPNGPPRPAGEASEEHPREP